MLPITFEGSNTVFTKPENWKDKDCSDLPAFKGYSTEINTDFINTVWKPSFEDLQALNNGGAIVLTLFSRVMIPVGMAVVDNEGQYI